MKILTWNLHVDGFQSKHRYNMILGCDILYKLKIYLFLFENKIRVNGGIYEGCKPLMKYVSKINFNTSYCSLKDEIFWNE